MLAARLTTGISLIAAFVAVLVLDEAMAPWYPFWLATSLIVMGSVALEVVGLLNETSARPSGNTVFGGVMALVLANWAPHVAEHLARHPRLVESLAPDASAPINL